MRISQKRVAVTVRLPKSLLATLDKTLASAGTDRNSYLVENLEKAEIGSFREDSESRKAILIRMSKALHDRLANIASKAGCSISQLVATVVSRLGD